MNIKLSLEDTLNLMQAIALSSFVHDPITGAGCSSDVVKCVDIVYDDLRDELSEAYNFDIDRLLYFSPIDQALILAEEDEEFEPISFNCKCIGPTCSSRIIH
jgi:hypothetical protein